MNESSLRLKHPILQGILMFCVFFDVSFIQLPSIVSARKIAFIIIFIVVVVRKRALKIVEYGLNHIKRLFISSLCILLYAVIICGINGVLNHQGSIIPRLVYFVIYSLIGCVLLVNYFDSEIIFMKAAVLGLCLQCIATIAIFFVPRISEIANMYIKNSGNVSFLRTDRATGLGAEASYLTLLLFLGVVFSNYLIRFSGKKYFYVISQALFIGTMFIVGRTGLYLSILYYLYLSIVTTIREKKIGKSLKIVLAVLVVGGLLLLIMRARLSDAQYQRLYTRLIGIINGFGNDQSILSLTSNQVPPISWETIIGTGVFRGYTASGTLIWHDSGYVQIYSSLGMIVGLVFYMTIFATYFKIINDKVIRDNKPLFFNLLYMFVAYLVIEIKEPFTLKYTLPLCFFVTVFLYNKRCKNEFSFD